jgi:hypothetical protein
MQFNRHNNRYLDIKSRGDISEYLQSLLKNGQIKDCKYLKIEDGHLNAFYPECTKQYASRIKAINVHTDPSAGGAPSSYFWPKCPKNCPYYSKSKDFIHSLNSKVEEIYNYESTSDSFVKVEQFSTSNSWAEIKKHYDINKRAFGKKINFVKDKYKRKIIFRDIEHAYFFMQNGFYKPAVILAGGVIEELLRLYLDYKKISPSDNTFNEYIKACDKNGLFKKGISKLSDSLRDFRNIVHLKNEVSGRYSISKPTAQGAISSIFTISNEF